MSLIPITALSIALYATSAIAHNEPPQYNRVHLDESARVIRVRGERQNLGVDQRHEVCALLFKDVNKWTTGVPTSGNGL